MSGKSRLTDGDVGSLLALGSHGQGPRELDVSLRVGLAPGDVIILIPDDEGWVDGLAVELSGPSPVGERAAAIVVATENEGVETEAAT